MRKQLNLKVINQKSKIFTFYEPSTVSYKSILKFYFKMRNFVDLVELEGIILDIMTKLYCQCLRKMVSVRYIFMETFCSDGASACMLGRKSGISAKILEMFLNVFNLALSHCIQLPLDDTMKDVKSIIHCKFFS